jgi:hypothetical protein
MKMTPVEKVPGKTGHYCNLQGVLKEFMAMDAKVVRLDVDGYKSSTVAASCICIAIKRSGYPIKSFKRCEFVYLSKVS